MTFIMSVTKENKKRHKWNIYHNIIKMKYNLFFTLLNNSDNIHLHRYEQDGTRK